ncbi:MAG: CRISPR-associated protein Cas4 [Clostridiaceae bacterium]|mgnify:FL=1|nr:CRISPR-associated protein Cas4 [Clostridiaceae bacterium]
MMKITGVMVEYYFICKKKLWYFANQIQMENEHENVLIGRMVDETSYIQEKKNILIDGTINIDFIRKHKQIHEVKKSKSIEEATIWQVKYYLYYLKKLGMEDIKGVIDYPLLRRNLIVELDENDEEKIEEVIRDIENIVAMPSPPAANKMKICSKCAYYELCFI